MTRRFHLDFPGGIDVTLTEDEDEKEEPMPLWTLKLLSPHLWYKADAVTGVANGADVLLVPDSGGNGRDMTPYNGNASLAPTYVTGSQNGLPALQFAGSFADEMRTTNAAAIAQPFTLVWVGKTANNTDFVMSRSTNVGMSLRSGVVHMLDSNDGTPDISTGASMNTTGWHVVVGLFNGATSYVSVDGTLSSVVTLTGEQQINGIDIGLGNNNSSFAGLFGEAAIIPLTVDASNRQMIEGAAAHKWGIAANLPGGHPYKSVPPKFGPPRTGLRYDLAISPRRRAIRGD